MIDVATEEKYKLVILGPLDKILPASRQDMFQ